MTISREVQALKDLVKAEGTQARAAKALGVTPQYFGDLLRGRRGCSDRILKRLGLQRVVVER